MKRSSKTILALLSAVAAFAAVVAVSGVQAAQTNLVAPLGSAIADSSIDGTIGTEWSDANAYTNIPINPTAVNAQISVKHDNTNLYILVVWQADMDQPWFAIEFGVTGCMNNGADGAVFGNNGDTTSGLGVPWSGGTGVYRDAEFGGPGVVAADTAPHGVGIIRNSGSNIMVVELKKPLNSLDSAGNDIAWTVGNTYSLLMTWDSDGGGNPGTAAGVDGMNTVDSQTLQLSSVAIPEFPTTAITLVAIAGTFVIVALAARRRFRA